MNLNNIPTQIKELENKVASIKGKRDLSESLFVASQSKLEELKNLQEINKKAIEVLNLIQHETRDRIKIIFENVVTKALQYIHQSNDYKFELLFDRRGAIPKLQFLLKTPDMQEAHDIMTTRAGGSKDIVALALRFVLLEISKIPGFIFLDEPEKRLDNPETELKMFSFIKENQMASNRQNFLITHKQSFVDSVKNPIILKKKCSVNSEHLTKMNINTQVVEVKEDVEKEAKTPKKRGRPKGSSKKNRST